jgi:hypothetical protein
MATELAVPKQAAGIQPEWLRLAAASGLTIPSVLRAGWWWGTDRQSEGEFFRAQITSTVFT